MYIFITFKRLKAIFKKMFDSFVYVYIEGLELKRTMSTLVGCEIIEFLTLQACEKSELLCSNKISDFF